MLFHLLLLHNTNAAFFVSKAVLLSYFTSQKNAENLRKFQLIIDPQGTFWAVVFYFPISLQ